MQNLAVYDVNKKPRKLSEKIGSGGQGDVFVLEENPNIVVKIFHSTALSDKEKNLRKKIHVQAQMQELINSPYLTWPQIEVFDDQGEWIGYAMKRAKGVPLIKLAHPMLYFKYFPGIDRRGIVRILLNLLTTIKKLHENSIHIGDINLGNVLSDPVTLKTFLIDTDSYQIKTKTGEIFHCPVGRPEMTPIEHHGQSFDNITRTVESDLFSIAILMFQCLMLGQHPYSQIGGGNPAENLRSGNFPYGRGAPAFGEDKSLPPGPWFIIWSHLTYKIKSLFIRTFRDGVNDPSARASISEWENVLKSYYWLMEKGKLQSEIKPDYPKPSSQEGQEENGE